MICDATQKSQYLCPIGIGVEIFTDTVLFFIIFLFENATEFILHNEMGHIFAA